MDILSRIDELRNAKGWSQYKLALEAGLTQSTITNMYSRRTLPSITTLFSICEALDISMAEFFADSDNENIIVSDNEKELVLSYRKLSTKNKTAVKSLCDSLI